MQTLAAQPRIAVKLNRRSIALVDRHASIDGIPKRPRRRRALAGVSQVLGRENDIGGGGESVAIEAGRGVRRAQLRSDRGEVRLADRSIAILVR